MKSENKGLEKQIKYNEKKNSRLLKQTESSISSGRGLSLGEEMKKVDELAKAIEKTTELEKQLAEQKKVYDSLLSLAEIKFKNSQTNASRLSEKLAKKDQELQATKRQNGTLSKQLIESKNQLSEAQASREENY